ncbi:MAG TPA: hypothetical protein H9738_11900 [Candidatus Blautia pullistercoris]|uniref:Uncharacterized protein n=1 Tax=Candidatus Blautia pullistercoris TaxID=2838499 RepID=A0A9D1VNE8_9FIRM|nr:hypothetical protein [Candidatus Blautia pullistercoris]
MTTLLEMKQKIKNFYGEHDTWLLPLLKFLLAFLVFQTINSTLGFLEALDNIFIVLILSIICAVLPLNGMAVLGCIMIVAHCYGVGVEVAAFSVLLLLLLMILFLRFTSRDNLALILTPAAFSLHMPAAVPVGAGLLRGPSCAVPACCGVVLYYFMEVVSDRSTVLQGKETESVQKLQILLDALINNQEMWLNILAFVVVLMVVYLISRTSSDYSWRIGDAAGAIIYILIMILGGMFLNVNINIGSAILSGVLAAVVGLVIEFAALGVDYSRSETTQFEDDEYVYYVKAVPKSFVAQAEKKIKNISTESVESQEKEEQEAAPVERVGEETFDFEKQLEESLKDL